MLKPGGRLVVGCLNEPSPWVQYYKKKAAQDPESVFRQAYFLSVSDLENHAATKCKRPGLWVVRPADNGDLEQMRQIKHKMTIQNVFDKAGYFVVECDKAD